MKNILVSIEITDESTVLIEKAAEIAELCRAKLWLVHIAAPGPEFAGYEAGPQYIRDFRAGELREEHRYLQNFEKTLSSKGIETTALMIQGATTEAILEECDKLNIDLLIIGHHRSNIFIEAFFGNTDSSIIAKSKIPVMVVPL